MASTSVTNFDTVVLQQLLASSEELKRRGINMSVMTLEQMTAVFDNSQKEVVNTILALNPKDYGVRTPYIGLEEVPDDLVAISGQRYILDGKTVDLGVKYLPSHIFDAYSAMAELFEAEHPGRKLLVQSGYRSPAYQILVFIRWCANAYGGDIAKTIRHASPPAHSQHAVASKTAIDIMNVDGSPTDEELDRFAGTVEYSWLKEYAGNFNFYESFPVGNEYDMRPEPWHWQYVAG